MTDILIKNGYVITMNPSREEYPEGDIAIDEGRITKISDDINQDAEKVIDAKGKAIIPGLINAHSHLPMVLLRGFADDLPLKEWLEDKIWPLESGLTEEHVYNGALLGCLEMIKSGTTCFADQYFFMDKVAEAVEESGLRASLSYGIIEQGDQEKRESEIEKGTELLKDWHGKANDRIMAMYGPHAPYSCSPECLEEIRDQGEKHGVGVHTHLSETENEVEEIIDQYGKRPGEHLKDLGILKSNTLIAHCVWVNEEEIEIIENTGAKPVHNPVSNMKLGSGAAPVSEMLSRGIPVALGTDGAASNNSLDMLEEIKFAALLQKLDRRDPTALPAQSALEMATINGAKALELEDEIGSIEIGKKADLILIDLNKPHLTPKHDVVSHLVYSSVGSDVDTVIVDGKILMEDREPLTLEENNILEKSQEASEDLISRSED
ncbi:MAG: amidohydrolase family protein [Hadesarchaea archaeon]|nr:amidohydrolase family protein [Hadesarchaea archaeon]